MILLFEKVVAKVMLVTLVENTSISKDFGSEHGLSLYIETKKHKYCLMWAQAICFLQNTKKQYEYC